MRENETTEKGFHTLSFVFLNPGFSSRYGGFKQLFLVLTDFWSAMRRRLGAAANDGRGLVWSI
jgi:hypothetical protein